MLLLSQDYGKHLLGVEDLLQKHALVEADISIQADRVRNVNRNAQKFADDMEGESARRIQRETIRPLLAVVLSLPPLPPPQVTNPATLRSSAIASLTWTSATRS